jgi:hypothetical protein
MGGKLMIKQLTVLAVCSLLIITITPLTEAKDQDRSETYQDCYVESSGTIINRFSIGLFKLGNKALIIYSIIEYSEDGVTSIYDDENGNILWQEQGEHSILLFFFRGNYSYIKDPENGTAFLVLDGLTLIARV